METVSFKPQNVRHDRLKGKALFYVPIIGNGQDDILHYAYLFGGDSSVITPSDCRIQPISQSIKLELKRLKQAQEPLILPGIFQKEDNAYLFSADIYRGFPGCHEKEDVRDILYGEFSGYMETYGIQKELRKFPYTTPSPEQVIGALPDSDFPDLLQVKARQHIIIPFTLENLVELFDKELIRGIPVLSPYVIKAYFDPTEENPETMGRVIMGLVKKGFLKQVFSRNGSIRYYELNRHLIEEIKDSK